MKSVRPWSGILFSAHRRDAPGGNVSLSTARDNMSELDSLSIEFEDARTASKTFWSINHC